MRTILIVFFVLLFIGVFPVWPYSAHWSYFPGIGIGTLLLLVLLAVFMSNKKSLR